jgi:uncharacterized membrane-anchored protein YhcB (DUF1043 family)
MEGYVWLILISMLAVGVLFGFVFGRSKGDVSAPKVRELEKRLYDADQEMKGYRGQVTQHFEKTATLFNQLTNDYREVYEHLANSSNQLCGTETAKIKSLTADSTVLEGQSQQAEAAPAEPEPAKAAAPAPEPEPAEEKQEAAEAAESETTPAEAQEAAAAESETAEAEEKQADSGEEAAQVPPVKETVAGEEEPRTIH